jgi:outer membrane protein OmpA-like peptidoglycan-associated protein
LEAGVVVREIIGLVSIAIGILLFGVSFYLFLRRSHVLPKTQLRRSAVVTFIYGLFFCVIGLVIERTTPAAYETDVIHVFQDSTRIVSPKLIEPAVDSTEIEQEEPPLETVKRTVDTPETVKRRPPPEVLRVAKKRITPIAGTMEQKQFVRRKRTDIDELAIVPERPKPIEDEIYETVDAFLSRIEAFLDRYAFPVVVESYSPPSSIFRPIAFSDTTADIPVKYFYLLNEAARLIKQHPEIGTVEIQSYTDGEGPEVYNYLITQSRANSARDYLISQGVEPERLVAKGYGAVKPPKAKANSGKFYLNRRIEFVPLAFDQTSRTR